MVLGTHEAVKTMVAAPNFAFNYCWLLQKALDQLTMDSAVGPPRP